MIITANTSRLMDQYGDAIIQGTITDAELRKFADPANFAMKGLKLSPTARPTDNDYTALESQLDFVTTIGPKMSPDALEQLITRLTALEAENQSNPLFRNISPAKFFMAYESLVYPDISSVRCGSGLAERCFPPGEKAVPLHAFHIVILDAATLALLKHMAEDKANQVSDFFKPFFNARIEACKTTRTIEEITAVKKNNFEPRQRLFDDLIQINQELDMLVDTNSRLTKRKAFEATVSVKAEVAPAAVAGAAATSASEPVSVTATKVPEDVSAAVAGATGGESMASAADNAPPKRSWFRRLFSRDKPRSPVSESSVPQATDGGSTGTMLRESSLGSPQGQIQRAAREPVEKGESAAAASRSSLTGLALSLIEEELPHHADESDSDPKDTLRP